MRDGPGATLIIIFQVQHQHGVIWFSKILINLPWISSGNFTGCVWILFDPHLNCKHNAKWTIVFHLKENVHAFKTLHLDNIRLVSTLQQAYILSSGVLHVFVNIFFHYIIFNIAIGSVLFVFTSISHRICFSSHIVHKPLLPLPLLFIMNYYSMI